MFTISGLVNYGQVNTIEMVNRGAWVQSATGISPTIVLQNVKVQSIAPPLFGEHLRLLEAQPYQTCVAWANVSGGTPPYSYQWYVDGTPAGNSYDLYHANSGSSYTVELYVTDAANTTQYASQYVWVNNHAGYCYY